MPQIPLAKGSERVSGWRREMASNHRYPALRQVLYPAKLSLHDGGSSPPNSVTQTGSRRTESRRVPGAEEWFLCSCLVGRHPRMSSSHHLTILRTSSLTIRENPRKRLGVGQLQILSPVVDSLSNRVNGCRWAVCETAAKLTSCRAAISPLRLCRVWMRPDLTGMLVRLHASKTFVSSRKSRCPPPATRRPP